MSLNDFTLDDEPLDGVGPIPATAIWNKDKNDPLGPFAESTAKVLNLTRQISDLLKINSENAQRFVNYTLSDQVKGLHADLADAIVQFVSGGAGGQTYTRAPDDTLILADATARYYIATRSLAEAILLTPDSKLQSALRSRVTSDNLTLAEALLRLMFATRAPVDSLLTLDSIIKSTTQAGQIYTQIKNELLLVADSVQRLTLTTRLASDVLIASDFTLRQALANRWVTDNLTLLEDIARFALKNRLPADGLVVADNVARVTWALRALTDNLTLIDGFVKAQTGTQTRVMSDGTLVLSDGVVIRRWLVKYLTETLTAADNAVLGRAIARLPAADAMALTDLMARAKVLPRVKDEPALTTADSSIRYLLRTVQLSDAALTTDQLLRNLAWARRLDEFFGITDGSIVTYISDIASKYDVRILIGLELGALLGLANDGMPVVAFETGAVLGAAYDGMPVIGVEAWKVDLGGYD